MDRGVDKDVIDARAAGPHRRNVVYVFTVSVPALERSWSLRKTAGQFAELYKRLRKIYAAATPDFPPRPHLGVEFTVGGAAERAVLARKLRNFLVACLELPRAMDCIRLREFLVCP